MNRIQTFAAGVAWLFFATSAWAHPGHGTTPPESLVHHVVEPVHAWVLVLLAGICGAAWVLFSRRRLARKHLPTQRESDQLSQK